MSASETHPPLVRMQGISKRFPGVQALDDVSVDLNRGEILGIAGENGSGKSTLVKILAGRYAPDAGEITLDGDGVKWGSSAAALRAGVALIAQEVLVHSELSVTENLLFGRMPRRRGGTINWKAARVEARAVLDDLGLDVSPDRRLGSLALHQKHMVSIGKALARRPEVLILDEPTSSLTEEQVELLFGLVRSLRDAGTSVIYITHRLREYFELCDRVAVLRDGSLVAERSVTALTESDLVRLMVGRALSGLFTRAAPSPPRVRQDVPALAVQGLVTPRKLRGIDLELRRGEIVGVAGQAGSGRTTLAQALFGVLPYSGSVAVGGAALRLRSPRDAIRAGIGYVPEDRKGAGLVLSSSVHENLVLPSRARISRFGVLSPAHEARIVHDAIERLGIHTPSPETATFALSGGNQQKVVIGKWLARRPAVLILDEPTRGVDVGAKNEIYGLVEELAASGISVLVCSSELLELLRLADRIVVMAHGQAVGELSGEAATEEAITEMAFAGLRDAVEAAA